MVCLSRYASSIESISEYLINSKSGDGSGRENEFCDVNIVQSDVNNDIFLQWWWNACCWLDGSVPDSQNVFPWCKSFNFSPQLFKLHESNSGVNPEVIL